MKTLARRSQELVLRPQVALHNRIFNRLDALRRREQGQGTVEYVAVVVVAGTIVLVLVAVAPEWGEKLKTKLGSIIDEITGS